MKNYSQNSNVASKWVKWIGISVLVIFLLITINSAVYLIDPGYRGVKVTFGQVDKQSYINGIGLKMPFVSKMVPMDVRTKKITAQTSTYTSDVQTAQIKFTFTYNLNPNNVFDLYEKIGLDYESKKIVPVLTDVMKDIIGKWQAQDLVSNRDKARLSIINSLNSNLDKTYFQNFTLQLINIDYSDKFEGAIEDKVIAEQKAQEAVNTTRKITEEANQKIITAKAEAEAMQIKAEALARNKSLTEYEAVKKWNGVLPQYMLGNSVPMLNLPAGKSAQNK